jgi:regulator of replication initiation timing
MDIPEESTEDRSPHNERNNNEQENINEEIYVELNDQSSELLHTVKDLKTKIKSVKEENEIILRVQEELNKILLDKYHQDEKDKRTKVKSEYGTMSYKQR